jgi:hypothetical protein
MGLDINMEEIEKQIESDFVMVALQKKRENWLAIQAEKRKTCFEKIATAQAELKALQHDVYVAKGKAKAKVTQISKLHHRSHYNYGRLRRLDTQISLRRRRVKAAAIAKATALAQREALKRFGL